MADRLVTFLRKYLGMSVKLDERSSLEITDATRHGACYTGVLANSVDTTGLHISMLSTDPLALVTPRHHLLA